MPVHLRENDKQDWSVRLVCEQKTNSQVEERAEHKLVVAAEIGCESGIVAQEMTDGYQTNK